MLPPRRVTDKLLKVSARRLVDGKEQPVTATPFWFGPTQRPLFGWLHRPAGGTARGGVVICPPLGIEAICVYFSTRTLADRLAEAGIAVVRFDYDGTGDSFGAQDDAGRTPAWLGSVTAALDALRGTGIGPVGLVGIRMGALLAATIAEHDRDLAAVVLWDPCISGRSFLREQRAFRLLSIGGDDADRAVDAPGMRFDAETVEGMEQLDLLRAGGMLAPRVLVLEDPERPRSRRLAGRLGDTGVEWTEATGQAALLDPPRQEPPYEVIDEVRDWLATAIDGPAVPVRVPPAGAAIVGVTPSGKAVVERPVVLGPAALFGIVTQPAGPAVGPTVVFVNEGNSPHIGQSRLWVELGRSWAAAGLQVLRFDLSGNGDSASRPGRPGHVAWAPEAFDDVVDACAEISPDDPSDVVLVGLCSGAYQSVEHALAHPTRGVCLINPALSFPSLPGDGADVRRPARQKTKRRVVASARPILRWASGRVSPRVTLRWEQALEAGSWPASVASRHPRVPQRVWWTVNRLLLDDPAASTLQRLVRRGTDVTVICGPPDFAPLALGEQATLRRLERSERFHLQVISGLDHAGLVIEQRESLKEALSKEILGRYIVAGPEPADPPVATRDQGPIKV